MLSQRFIKSFLILLRIVGVQDTQIFPIKSITTADFMVVAMRQDSILQNLILEGICPESPRVITILYYLKWLTELIQEGMISYDFLR
jgi:hypothetical protein